MVDDALWLLPIAHALADRDADLPPPHDVRRGVRNDARAEAQRPEAVDDAGTEQRVAEAGDEAEHRLDVRGHEAHAGRQRERGARRVPRGRGLQRRRVDEVGLERLDPGAEDREHAVADVQLRDRRDLVPLRGSIDSSSPSRN